MLRIDSKPCSFFFFFLNCKSDHRSTQAVICRKFPFFRWTRCHVHMLRAVISRNVDVAASRCVFAAVSAGNRHVGLTSRGQRIQTQHQHLLSAAASPALCLVVITFYVRNNLRFTHFTLCGNFILFFPLVGWDWNWVWKMYCFYCYLSAFWDVYFSWYYS